ncbi:TWiK family of potassium channels protein 7-like [Pollicipes pollicipes]|uniref:TWiK family of potassium channels protein 7-like n=1 Tax=Pollicipes pollicipes TaxID=41117 RepID=UPI0018856059|nr:TWiK family of potassium channels protein 7-like [Pollicipes pollicipes]
MDEKPAAQAGHPAPHDEPISLCTRLLKFLFGHVGLFLLVSAVAALGAMAFMELEKEHEAHRYLLKKNRARDILDANSYISSFFWHYQANPNITWLQWDRKVQNSLKQLEQYVADAVNTYQYDGTVDGWNTDWTFSKALLFTISIMTTIGYGHIFPRTFRGQLFTIIYAMIGSPLLLVFLANVGDGMAKTFTYIYSRICCRWCRSRRYRSEAGPGKRAKRLSDDVVGSENFMPTDKVQVPIVINLILIGLCLVFGAVIFATWESWSFSSACYFSFVTLSTIGFGDMVPGNSFLDTNDDGMASFKMAFTIVYCIFGMALISMCIQMMQEQIVTKVRWTAHELGIMKTPAAGRRVVRYKRSRRGAVLQTADDADGANPTSGWTRRH